MSIWRFLHTIIDSPRTTDRHCRCLFLLELALSEDPVAVLDERNPDWIGYGEVTLGGHQVLFCPKCGGSVGSHRSELVAAHRSFQAARAKQEPALKGVRDFAAFEELCRQVGAVCEETGGGYGREAILSADSISLSASWDPDHERVYASCHFSPGAALLEAPYRQ